MSVISKNPFDLLGDGDSSSPAPAKATPAPAAAGAKATPAPRAVPGAAGANANKDAGAARGARGGRYPSRGGPRTREDRGPRNTLDAATGEGQETAGGFDGERVAPAKRNHNGPDKHTKGPRAERSELTSGGHKARGSGAVRGAKTPVGGGERRQFERRSGTNPDSQKKVDSGWGANEGTAELTAEVEGEKDAQAEETAPGTPAEAPVAAAEAAVEATPEEPEEVQKSYDDFLAEKAASAFAFGKKEGRTVNSETLEGKAFVREGIDDFFSGKEKTAASKSAKAKKEKVYIEVDGQFAKPAGDRPPRGDRPERGGRGGGRGRGEGRGRGGARGGAAPRGGFARSNANANAANISDEKAFPALGA